MISSYDAWLLYCCTVLYVDDCYIVMACYIDDYNVVITCYIENCYIVITYYVDDYYIVLLQWLRAVMFDCNIVTRCYVDDCYVVITCYIDDCLLWCFIRRLNEAHYGMKTVTATGPFLWRENFYHVREEMRLVYDFIKLASQLIIACVILMLLPSYLSPKLAQVV